MLIVINRSSGYDRKELLMMFCPLNNQSDIFLTYTLEQHRRLGDFKQALMAFVGTFVLSRRWERPTRSAVGSSYGTLQN
jgi:hypothetical protein